MILVAGTEAIESLRIMADENCAHVCRNGGLPRIIFAHALSGAPLNQRDPRRVDPVNPVPGVAAHVRLDGVGILGPLENFRQGNWGDPQITGAVAAQPLESWARFPGRDLVQ